MYVNLIRILIKVALAQGYVIFKFKGVASIIYLDLVKNAILGLFRLLNAKKMNHCWFTLEKLCFVARLCLIKLCPFVEIVSLGDGRNNTINTY